MKNNIYLDYAAATPIDENVLEAMRPFFDVQFYNPSALYEPARRAAKALSAARSKIARSLGVKTSEIIFTAGATEANNLVIHGTMYGYPYTTIAVSAIEHDSVRTPAKRYRQIIIPVDEQGLIKPAQIPKSVSESTVLVSIIYANNEVGCIQPIRRIAAELAEIKKKRLKSGNKLPLLFHIDAVQAGNYLDLHVHRLGVDLMTLSAGKLYGPKQAGVLYARAGVELLPLIEGGGQERGLRSGTENVAAAAGMAEALEVAQMKRKDEAARLLSLNRYFISELRKVAPKLIINGSEKYRLPNNLHVTFPGTDNERLLMALDGQGIQASAGSACSASQDEPSHTLKAMGLSKEAIRSSIRFSLGRQTTKEDIDITVKAIAVILA